MKNYHYLLITLFSLMTITSLPGNAEISQNKLNLSNHSEIKKTELLVNQLNKSRFNNTNQIRCWQHGQLIFDEKGLSPVTKTNIDFKDQIGSTLRVYDFGETFCLFTGE